MAVDTKTVATVTRKELLELREAEEALKEASRLFTLAENAVQPLRMALAEKVLGTKTEAEYRALDPETLASLMEKREKRGEFEVLRGAPNFSFEKTAAGRYPAWKSEFIDTAGQAEADRITAATPVLYSYRIHVE